MSREIVQCSCGIRTREPFLIGGVMYCALCAEIRVPSLVARKARDWQTFDSRNRVAKRTIWKDVSWE